MSQDRLGFLENSTSKANASKVFVTDNSFIQPQVVIVILMPTKQRLRGIENTFATKIRRTIAQWRQT